MVYPFGALQPFRHHRKTIKCDQCNDSDIPYCVKSCPTKPLILAESEEIEQGKLRILGKDGVIGLDFISDKTLSKF